jgi:hypothetical protein
MALFASDHSYGEDGIPYIIINNGSVSILDLDGNRLMIGTIPNNLNIS